MHDTVELLARKDTDTMTDESMPHGSLDVAQSEQNQSEKTLPSNQANTTHRSDGDEDREVHDAESAPEEQASAAAESPAPAKEHPRKDLADWKWKCTIFVIFMTSFINGEFLLVLLNARSAQCQCRHVQVEAAPSLRLSTPHLRSSSNFTRLTPGVSNMF